MYYQFTYLSPHIVSLVNTEAFVVLAHTPGATLEITYMGLQHLFCIIKTNKRMTSTCLAIIHGASKQYKHTSIHQLVK